MRNRKRHTLWLIAAGVAAAALVVLVQNIAIACFLPQGTRVATDFSPAFLRRELDRLAASPPAVVFLGDSVLWGYGLHADQSAVSLLRADGCDCLNLSFKSGNPINDYALVRLMQAWGIRPKLVVIEVNQKVFNPADGADQHLHPAIAQLVAPMLTADDRTALSLPAEAAPDWRSRVDRTADSLSTLYAMRADIRDMLFGSTDALPSKPLSEADFEGTYDLEALDDDNLAVGFLEKTVRLLHARRIPVVAFMTPTNHRLVGKFVETPEYQANVHYLSRLLENNGARVLDLDASLPGNDFIDNDHLTFEGQRKLASILRGALL